MIRRLLILLLAAAAAGMLVLRAQSPAAVDFRADVMSSLKVGDSTALLLVGHVVFHHNGAVITCDSAIRYNDRRMDCYKNVVVNKDSTFIFGDKADYDGLSNEAHIYSPLIKMIDKDATLYTYHFSFNTLTNVGHYWGGGTMSQKDNLMESSDGYYYVDTRDLVGVRNVEMRNPDYVMESDSVSYNMNAEIASFHTLSYIWNAQNEFLTAYRGIYDRRDDRYTFTDRSYIMTETQQMWADTIVYRPGSQDALMLSNVQIVDEQQRALAFGDYARYWGNERKALLTRDPVVAGYDEGEQADTVFMRADSIFLYTVNRFAPPKDSLTAAADSSASDSLVRHRPGSGRNVSGRARDSLGAGPGLPQEPLTGPAAKRQEQNEAEVSAKVSSEADSTGSVMAVDSLQSAQPADSVGRPLTEKELKKLETARLRYEKEQAKKQKREERAVRIKEKIKAQREKARLEAEKIREKEEQRQRRELARRFAKGKSTSADTLALHALDSAAQARRDSIALAADSSLRAADSLSSREEIASDSVQPQAGDSLVRIIRAYNKVRTYRTDFQAVCDSLVAFSADSTIHMYVDPVLWSEQNQITSQVVDIFTKNQTIDKAVFTGEPLMCSEVEPERYYNQVKGKVMEAYFRKGEIYKMDVNGNGQTYYFMEDGDSTDRYVNGFLVAECADITFHFIDRQLDQIVYKGKPSYTIYPMDKIPETQPLVMKGFRWEAVRRPAKQDVFDRSVKPSQRERYESMPKPTYPITGAIDEARKRLSSEGWNDRTDRRITPEAEEFVRSLGN